MNKHKRELVTVATFDRKADAQELISWLEHEHLPAEIQDERRLQKYWFLAEPRAGVHVQTTKDAFARATSLMHQPAAAPLMKNAVLCPSCGSSRVQYPDLTRKNILPTLFADVFVLLHFVKHKYYCEDCHFSWR